MIELQLGRGRAVWTDRHGGVSAPPYDHANLSTRVDDAPDAVRENRIRVAAALDLVPPEEWWWLDQEHGRTTVVADAVPPATPPRADATVTTHVGVPLTVLTADCAPIALASDDAVGVVHAGWHGIVAGVIQEAVSSLRAIGQGEIRAALGPCIHAPCYEFGRADLDRVIELLGPEVESQTDRGAPALDLPRAVHLALASAGVAEVADLGVCTATSRDHFSHRRDGPTGRQALVMVLEP